jgi:hypothetical protein
VQDKGMHNIFNKIIAENFPGLEKEMPIEVQEVCKTQNRHDQNRTSPQHIIVKQLGQRTKKEYWKLQERKIK